MSDIPPPAAGRPDRLEHVDALRGFALAGILTVNIWAFADPYLGSLAPNPSYGALDHALRFVVALLFEGKFYLLFSFLFGLSVQLQAEAAERAGADGLQRMRRRHRALLALGLAHALLLFEGDILMLYALLGGALMRRHDWTARRSLRAAAALVLASGLVWLLAGALMLRAEVGATASGAEAERLLAAYRGSALDTLRMRWSQLPVVLTGELLLQGPSALAMFLFGRTAGRLQWLSDVAALRARLRRLLPLALPVGLAGAAVYAWFTAPGHGFGVELMSLGTMILTGPLLSLVYVAAMLAWFERPSGASVMAALAPLGRMALTNYLSQSLLLGLVFTGYGFALIDRLPVPAVLALVPAIIGLQMLFSRWWLRRHPYGPAEWLLRAATIGRRPPWRLAGRADRSAFT